MRERTSENFINIQSVGVKLNLILFVERFFSLSFCWRVFLLLVASWSKSIRVVKQESKRLLAVFVCVCATLAFLAREFHLAKNSSRSFSLVAADGRRFFGCLNKPASKQAAHTKSLNQGAQTVLEFEQQSEECS